MNKQPLPRPPPPASSVASATSTTAASSSSTITTEMPSPTSATTPKPKRTPILPNEIKCILLQGYGSVKQLKAISIPRPTPGDGEVLVHVKSWFVEIILFKKLII